MNHSAVSTQVGSVGLRFRLADLIARVGRFPRSIHQLLFRLAIAGVFLRAGLTKITSWESTVALFADEYKVPVLAALPLIGMIMTIQLFVYPQAWSEHLVWGSILLFLVTRGGGAISLDRLITGRAE